MMFTYFEVEKLMYKFKYAEKQPSSIIWKCACNWKRFEYSRQRNNI